VFCCDRVMTDIEQEIRACSRNGRRRQKGASKKQQQKLNTNDCLRFRSKLVS